MKITFVLNLITLIVQLLLGCDDRYGYLGISSDKEESQRRGVWVCDYAPINRTLTVNQKTHVTIKEAYLEHVWRYGNNDLSNTTVNSGYWFVIHFTNDSDLNEFATKWGIGSWYNDMFRNTSSHSIVIDLEKLPPANDIFWSIYSGEMYPGTKNPVKVGELRMQKIECADSRLGH